MTLDQTFTPLFLRYDRLASTNTEALRQAQQGAAEGLCVIAREQTAGRGRQDRTWTSPRDAGLYLSIVLRPRLPLDLWPMLTLMAAVSVHETLQELFELVADIKWPNDIIASERKLAGILAETVDSASGRAAVIGIGVNLLDVEVPVGLRDTATNVARESGRTDIDTDAFATLLVRRLANWYEILHQPAGDTRLATAWSTRSSYAVGKLVSVVSGGETFTGTTQGLSDQGALRLLTEAGDLRIIHSAEVTAIRPTGKNDQN